jgi:tryptophanyl-tRNA synthetase
MSTTYGSEQGTVYILDDADVVRKKVRSAVTDSGTDVRRAADKEGITNLIEILSVTRDVDPEEIEREFAGSGYGDFKGAVADAVVEYLAPTRERYAELRPDESAIDAALAAGAEKARAIAADTLADVRDVMGVGPARAHSH